MCIVTFATPWRERVTRRSTARCRFVLGFFVGGAFLSATPTEIRLSFGVALLLGVAAFAAYGTPVYEMALRAALGYGLMASAVYASGKREPEWDRFPRSLQPVTRR